MIIYKITNKINGKLYIGQTVGDLRTRWKRHCWNCTSKHNTMPISHAIKKYGKENFYIEIIYECNNIEELNEAEKKYAHLYNSFSPNGYNLVAGGGCGAMSNETKEKLRIANTGKIRTPEMIRRLSDSHKGFVVAEETKRKISIKNKGRPTSELARKRCSEACSKDYVAIDPSGKIVHIHGLGKFCFKNGHSRSKMSELLSGKRSKYKGWKMVQKNIANGEI